MEQALRLGPFLLDRPLGRGGMGTVWAGQHEKQGLPVAVKVLHARFADHSWFLSSFATEVRAVARLRHPNIVTILDHGVVGRDAPAMLEKGAGPGSPWLAMEQVDGEPLSKLKGGLDWAMTRRVLRGLLDGLAHAHARGVLHRDIKPGNVLVGPERVVLLDFGIARLQDPAEAGPAEDDEGGSIVGTAAYMAPEQFWGREAALGPWTDLYALGCLAWSILEGEPPFGRRRPVAELRDDHLHKPLPALRPRAGWPAGFEGWLRRLLEKSPQERFQRAADAAWALAGIEREGQAEASTFRWTEAPTQGRPTLLPLESLADEETWDASLIGPDRPPLPPDWQRLRPAPQGMKLVGAGLRLFGLRAIPLIGREEQRDALWSALSRVDPLCGPGSQQAVLLQGPAGSGKSALASWLCEQAHEQGTAEILVATHSAGGSPGDGLLPAVARWLRCAGASREDLVARVNTLALRWNLGPGETRDLLALLGAGEGLRRLSTPGERHAALARLLSLAARERPVVLRLEDVHWGADTLTFVLHALARWKEDPAPVLLLLTARELRPSTPEAQLLERVLAWPEAHRLEVGPLAPGWRSRLIEELLHLDGDLARQVEHRTGGNPLFMVQLVGDWVQRGVLVPGERGFELRPGIRPELPDDLRAVWQARVDRALHDRDPRERRALELAAILGMTVDRAEWRTACRHAEAWASDDLVERLLNEGLVEPGPEGPGFSFVHGMLRESLVLEASRQGRARSARLGCVAMLREKGSETGRDALRLGRHLLALGELDAAIDPLGRGAWACVVDSEYLLAEEALREREDALRKLALPASDPRPCEGWIMAARVARRRGDHGAAGRFTALAERAARAQGWPVLLCQALRERARLAEHSGRRKDAILALEEAVQLAARADDPLALGWSRRDLGLLRVEAGEDARAVNATLADALSIFQARGEIFGEATCQLGRGRASLRSGQVERGHRLLQAAAEGFQRSIQLQEPAHAWVGLGEVARLSGDLAEAERRYREAIARFHEIGNPGTPTVTLQLAAVLLLRRETGESGQILRQMARDLQADERLGLLPPVHAHLAWHAALLGRAGQATRALLAAKVERPTTGTADPLAAEAARCCALVAEEQGQDELVARALGFVQSCSA